MNLDLILKNISDNHHAAFFQEEVAGFAIYFSKTINPFLKNRKRLFLKKFFTKIGEMNMEKILIIDVDCRINPLLFLDFGLKILFGQEMTKTMLNCEVWGQIDPWQTLLVFPGNGSNLVKKQIEETSPGWLSVWPYKSYVPAKRFWEPGQNPQAAVGNISRGVYIGLKQVIVIDDVISSGETCSKVYKRNHIYTPGAKWLAACWVAQKSARLKNFSSVRAGKTVGEENKRAPINSLSTLITDKNICRIYSERNFFNQAKNFQALIESCRR